MDVVIFFSPFCSFTSYDKIDVWDFRRGEGFIFSLGIYIVSQFLIHSINLLYTIYIINISVRFLHNVSFVIFYPYICTRTVKIMKIKHVLNQLKDLFQRARCAHVLPDRLVQKSDDIVFH